MGIFGRIFRSRPRRQERSDTRTAIVEALTRAIAERGYATHQDCADLGLPRSTVFYHLGMLVKHGEFRRSRGRYYLVSKVGNAATISNVVVRKSTAEMLQAVQASASEPAPPPPSRRQPVPPEHEHRRICPAPEPEEPPIFQHALFTWQKLREELTEVERQLPGIEAWAKDVYDRGIAAGNPPGNVYRNILHVELSRRLRKHGFDELCRRFPQVDWDRTKVDGFIDARLKAAEKDHSPALTIASAYADFLLKAEHDQRPPPSPTPPAPTLLSQPRYEDLDDYAKMRYGKPREIADPERERQALLRDYVESQAEKNRARAFITMDLHAASNEEVALAATCIAQHEEHRMCQEAKANSDASATPTLATRI